MKKISQILYKHWDPVLNGKAAQWGMPKDEYDDYAKIIASEKFRSQDEVKERLLNLEKRYFNHLSPGSQARAEKAAKLIWELVQ